MTPKVIQKTYTNIKRNFIEKLIKNDSKIGAQGGSNEPAFRSLDPSWGHPAAQRDPTVPKGRPWEAKWRPRSSKMEPKWSQNWAQREPNGENGAPSEPKLIKQSVKNKAVECYSLHLATARQTHPRRSLSVFVNSRFRQLPSEVNSRWNRNLLPSKRKSN